MNQRRRTTEEAEEAKASLSSEGEVLRELSGGGRRYGSCEEVDSDELNNSLNHSAGEEDFIPKKEVKSREKKKKAKGRKFRQQVDTNIFSIKLSCLKDKGEIATGDPVTCKMCQAYFNMHSKYADMIGGS